VANNGDTIMIGAGTYPVNVEIAKSLTLQGAGAGETILDGGSISSALIVDAGATVNVQGVTVQRGGDPDAQTPGGIIVRGNVSVSDCQITNNVIGILNDGGVVQVVRTTISNNRADVSGLGGGILSSGETTLSYSTVSANSGTGTGGIAQSGGSVSLSNSTVSRNTALAVANILVTTGIFTLLNSTVSLDTGTGEVNILADSGTLSLVNSTVVTKPGIPNIGFSTIGQASIGNSILSSPAGTANCSGTPSVLSLGRNLSSDNSCGLTDPTDMNNSTAINLGLLQMNAPGTTATHALLPGSAAIDAGNCSGGIATDDQRGVSRPAGPACDIGAYELRTPIANDDAYAAFAGRTFVLLAPGVMTNDVSPDGLPITVYSATSPANGTISFVSNGALFYTPNSGFTGQDSVAYTLSDGVHTSNTAMVTFNVTSSNSPPVTVPDSYTVMEGQVLTVNAAQGVLANDSDPDGDPLTTLYQSLPTHGTLAFHIDGSFTYTPNRNFFGTDSFTYTASDGHFQSAPTTVTIAVKPNFGTITIALSTQPQSESSFSFTGTLGNFTLGGSSPSSKTFEVGAGTWSVSELRPKPWLMTNIICNVGPGASVDLTRNNLQVVLNDGDSKTCTFVNQLPGEIKARAYHDLNGNGQHDSGEPWLRGWSMQVYLNATVPVANGVTGTNGTASFPNLQAQIYTVCEVPPAGWHTTNPIAINPTYGKPCFTVNLNPGQEIPVLFGNSK
jgi:Bacterial Ig domain